MRAWLLNNLGLKLLSLFLAMLLWAVVLGEQKVDVTVSVPLALNLPPELVLVNSPGETLEVRLRGPRTLVTNLPSREVVLEHVPSVFEEGENIISIRPDMFGVPRGIQVVDVTPHRIRVVVEPLVEREVEVIPRMEGELAQGYVLRGVTVNPSRILLSGPASELRRVTRVRTAPIGLEGHTAPFTVQALVEPAGRQVRVKGHSTVAVQVDIGPRAP